MDSGARFRQTVIATMMFMMLTNAEKNVIKFRGGLIPYTLLNIALVLSIFPSSHYLLLFLLLQK